MYISVIFPAYNEAARIQAAIYKTAHWFAGSGWDVEIIVVNNGSTDGTREIATAAALEVLADKMATGNITFRLLDSDKGKGAAIKKGLKNAAGTWTLITDVDLSTPIMEVGRLIKAALVPPAAELVIGSRKLKRSLVLGFGIKRRFTSWVFSIMARLLTPVPSWIHDTQCGFKLISGDAARDLAEVITLDGFAFDVELLAAARLKGYRIREVPVIWSHDPTDSKVKIIRDSLAMAGDLFKITRNWANNFYDA